jgi:ketosteroid isomerase-like protein
MTLAHERAALEKALLAWKAGDLDTVVSLMADDILYVVNVDGIQVPYAMSAVGKEDVRQRLELVVITFALEQYEIEKIVHDADHSRATARGTYRHRKTGEILDIRFSFRAWIEDGMLVRVSELHDAAYIHAFEKFVFHLQTAAAHLTEEA